MKFYKKMIIFGLTFLCICQSKDVFAAVNQNTGIWLYDDENTQIAFVVITIIH